jgi:hypothetical protein
MSKLTSLLACLLLSGPAVFAAPATDGQPPKPTASPAGKISPPKGGAAAGDNERENAALQNIQPGQTYRGVHIPNYDANGKLLMLFDAESARRVSDRDIEMEMLKIEIHNQDGTTFHVEMKHSVLDLDTRILTSDTPTTIKRSDFVINGDRAEFHTKEKFGRMFGNVKMVIDSSDAK